MHGGMEGARGAFVRGNPFAAGSGGEGGGGHREDQLLAICCSSKEKQQNLKQKRQNGDRNTKIADKRLDQRQDPLPSLCLSLSFEMPIVNS